MQAVINLGEQEDRVPRVLGKMSRCGTPQRKERICLRSRQIKDKNEQLRYAKKSAINPSPRG